MAIDGTVSMPRHSQEWPRVPRPGGHVARPAVPLDRMGLVWAELEDLGAARGPGGSAPPRPRASSGAGDSYPAGSCPLLPPG